MSELRLNIEKIEGQRCFELLATQSVTQAQLSAGWPIRPGATGLDSSGRIEALHFAPGRWLLPDPTVGLLASLTDREDVVLIDVEGKWQRRRLSGHGLWRALSSGADFEAMLEGRDCAALSLFDCPVLVARADEALELWVQSSYARFLDERLDRE